MCRKVVVNIHQIKSNAEGSSPLRIPACAIRIMEFTLSKDAKPFCSFPHNKLLVILMRVSDGRKAKKVGPPRDAIHSANLFPMYAYVL